MSPDGRRRSREHWTDSMEAGPVDPPAHVHRLPKVVRVAMVGLTAAVFLLSVALGLVAVYVYQANQYVQGRGEFRDEESARTNERINQAMCDLLDTLPEGGLLERPRAKYGCGPGIPIDQLTPGEQARIQRGAPSPETAAPTAVPSAPFSGGAVGPPARETEPPAPTRPPMPNTH